MGHSQSLTPNWRCQRSHSPRKQMQPTYAAALWSEWERLQGRSPLMWLERALSRARSRRSLACSCLGLRGSSSLITRSDLTIKRKRKMHISTEINHLGEWKQQGNGWSWMHNETRLYRHLFEGNWIFDVFKCAKLIVCCDISSDITFPTDWLNIEWFKLHLPKLSYVIWDR